MKVKFTILILLSLLCNSIYAQLSERDITNLVNRTKDDYSRTGMLGPKTYKTNSGYRVLVLVVNTGKTNHNGKMLAEREAIEYLRGAEQEAKSVLDINSDMSSSKEKLSDKIIQTSKGQVKNIETLCKINEEIIAYYLVISKTNANKGLAGLMSMVVPGAGQFYKGSTAKGAVFLGLTAAAAAGVIICETTSSQYNDKYNNVNNNLPMYSSEDANALLKEYSDKKKSWRTGTYICIGAAGVVYLWNVFDAFISEGAQRPVYKKGGRSLTIAPKAGIDNFGVSLAYKF